MSETQQGFNPLRVTGVPSKNGEFKSVTYTEQPETVTMKLYDRGTGTCFNPPLSTTAAFALAFWQDVDIPDVTIERARTLYAAAQNQEFVDHFQTLSDRHMAEWEIEHPKASKQSWFAARREEEADFAQRNVDVERGEFFHAENPQYLGNANAQQIVRAWFTYRNGPNPDRFPAEAEKLDNHSVELFSGSETIGVLQTRFRLNRFADQLLRVPDPSVDAIHQMQDVLADLIHTMSQNVERTANNTEPQEL